MSLLGVLVLFGSLSAMPLATGRDHGNSSADQAPPPGMAIHTDGGALPLTPDPSSRRLDNRLLGRNPKIAATLQGTTVYDARSRAMTFFTKTSPRGFGVRRDLTAWQWTGAGTGQWTSAVGEKCPCRLSQGCYPVIKVTFQFTTSPIPEMVRVIKDPGSACNYEVTILVPEEPAQKTTNPFKCTGQSKEAQSPYQIVDQGGRISLTPVEWVRFEPGNIEEVWSFGKPERVEAVDGCSISPVDRMVYCLVAYKGKKIYLGRLDRNGIAYVASAPDGVTAPADFAAVVSATFDETGTFWLAAGTSIWKIGNPSRLRGCVRPWLFLPKLDTVTNSNQVVHGADAVVFDGHYISIVDGEVRVTNLKSAKVTSFLGQALVESADLPQTTYPSAYKYRDRIFFSTGNGKGVFELLFSDRNFQSFVALGYESWKVGVSDGLNCLNQDAAVQVPTTTTTAPVVEKQTEPQPCDVDTNPYQVVLKDNTFSLVPVAFDDDELTPFWSFSKDLFPDIAAVDGCGINPKDNVVYCLVVNGNAGYVTRIDESGFAYVAEGPRVLDSLGAFSGGESEIPSGGVSATFDEDGTLWIASGTILWKGAGLETLKGWEAPKPDLPQAVVVTDQLELVHGADAVVVEEKFISIRAGEVRVTDLGKYKTGKSGKSGESSEPKSWVANASDTNLEKLPTTAYPAAYWFNGEIIFSTGDAEGVFQLGFSGDFTEYEAIKYAEVGAVGNDDGLNCLFQDFDAQSAFKDHAAPPAVPQATLVALGALWRLVL